MRDTEQHRSGDIPNVAPIALCLLLSFLVGCATDSGDRSPQSPETSSPSEPSLRAALRETPRDPALHYELANSLFDSGRFEEAAASYQRAVDIDPTFANAYTNLGLALRMQNRLKEAIQSYDASLAIHADDEITLQNLAIALELAEDFHRLEGCLARLSKLAPDDAHLRRKRAETLSLLGRHEEAIDAYRAAIALDPADTQTYYDIGREYYSLESPALAAESWRAALERDVDHRAAHQALAVTYWELGDYDRSWRHVAECQRLGVYLESEFVSNLQEDSGRVGPDG